VLGRHRPNTDYADLRIMPITARKLASWAVTVALGSA
jgi:hypothetical protein